MSFEFFNLDALEALRSDASVAEGDAGRYLRKVVGQTFEDCGCWVWSGGLSKHSALPMMQTVRGGFSLTQYVRRMLLQDIAAGPMPKRWVATYTCETRLCVNPEHLKATTKKASAVAAGRRGLLTSRDAQAKSLKARRAKSHITEAMVAAVLAAASNKEAAANTGVSLSHCKNIRRGLARAVTANPFAGLGAR